MEDVSFDIYDGEIVGIVGESGCGKTTLMKAIYGNVERPMYMAQGTIELEVEDMGERKVIPSTDSAAIGAGTSRDIPPGQHERAGIRSCASATSSRILSSKQDIQAHGEQNPDRPHGRLSAGT
ncbi:MAG: ATP-binding cassette domain-containing protein [Caldilineaceae bacterium]